MWQTAWLTRHRLLQEAGWFSQCCAGRRLHFCHVFNISQHILLLLQVAAGFSAGSAIAVLAGGFIFCRLQGGGRRNLTFILCAMTAGDACPASPVVCQAPCTCPCLDIHLPYPSLVCPEANLLTRSPTHVPAVLHPKPTHEVCVKKPCAASFMGVLAPEIPAWATVA